jgi:hypothetical protein
MVHLRKNEILLVIDEIDNRSRFSFRSRVAKVNEMPHEMTVAVLEALLHGGKVIICSELD